MVQPKRLWLNTKNMYTSLLTASPVLQPAQANMRLPARAARNSKYTRAFCRFFRPWQLPSTLPVIPAPTPLHWACHTSADNQLHFKAPSSFPHYRFSCTYLLHSSKSKWLNSAKPLKPHLQLMIRAPHLKQVIYYLEKHRIIKYGGKPH